MMVKEYKTKTWQHLLTGEDGKATQEVDLSGVKEPYKQAANNEGGKKYYKKLIEKVINGN
ncbi:hypothetical protein [Tannerella forsythia]|uniref:Uncharacterized protein n=1 Tax=Tannerella forsythia TaxID=28112 RepID=A0A3P1YPJ7_TANFO|nr:hypothetical protein [Tannerella forsythia]RRD72939.1 hypothetical protein EII41_10200 [Tannerella forsythia]